MSFRQPIIFSTHKGVGAALPAYAEFIATTKFDTDGTFSSFVINTPAGAQDGDTLILGVIVGNATVNTPSGWTLVQNELIGATNSATFVFRLTISGTPPASYTVTINATTAIAAGMVCYRSASYETSAESVNGAVANIVAPSITTTADYKTLVCLFSRDDSAAAITVPSSMTSRQSVTNGNGTRKITIADEQIPLAGATGTRTATVTGAVASYGVSLSL